MDKDEKENFVTAIIISSIMLFLISFLFVSIGELSGGLIRQLLMKINLFGIDTYWGIITWIFFIIVLVGFPFVQYKKFKIGYKYLLITASQLGWKLQDPTDIVTGRGFYAIVDGGLSIHFPGEQIIKPGRFDKKLERRYSFYESSKGYILVTDNFFEDKKYVFLIPHANMEVL